MAQMPEPAGPRIPASHDIYTALVAIALAIVAGTLGFVIYRTNELMGTPTPPASPTRIGLAHAYAPVADCGAAPPFRPPGTARDDPSTVRTGVSPWAAGLFVRSCIIRRGT